MRILTLAVLCIAPFVAAHAGQDSISLPAGARIYISPMEWQMDQYIVSEIRTQRLPVQLVATETQADFVMTGFADKLSSHFLSPGRCFQVKIATVGSGRTVWTGEGDDYATIFGRLRSHGPARAAKGIVGSLRNRFFRK